MKLIVNVFLVLLLTTFTAKADEALMTINFNQKTVAYQDKLFYAVREAVKAKPTVIFNVVDTSKSGAPGKGRQVANDIARIGVNPAQISYQPQAAKTPYEVVQIFVQ